MPKDKYKGNPTEEQVKEFELLQPLVLAAIREMREFAKKKQDGVVNEMKIRILNRLLDDVRKHLEGEPSARYLEALDATQLIQNSDVVLILGQYQAAMQNFRERFYKGFPTEHWLTKEYLLERDRLGGRSAEEEEE